MSVRTPPNARAAAAPRLPRRLRALPRRLARALVRRCRPSDPRAAVRAFAVTVALAILVSLLLPATASAGITDAISDAIEGTLSGVFEKIMAGLFGRIQGEITSSLVSWIVAIPNFNPADQQQYVTGPAKSNIDAARQATSMLALGGLGAVMTLSIVRYWISGLSMRGSGGIEAFEGFSRTIFAVGLILLWPDAFRVAVALANSTTHTLMEWPSVKEDISGLWGWTTALTAGAFALNAPVAVIITIIIFTGFALLLLALVMMKIMLTAGTAVIYVGMPLAIAWWPLPELAWIARLMGRGFVVCLLTPIGWTIIFVTFAALGADFFTLDGQGGVLDKVLIKPLVAIAMLSLAISLPRALGKAALLGAINTSGGNVGGGGGGGGFVGRMASSLAARRADALLAQHIPAAYGGRMQPPGGGGRGRTPPGGGGRGRTPPGGGNRGRTPPGGGNRGRTPPGGGNRGRTPPGNGRTPPPGNGRTPPPGNGRGRTPPGGGRTPPPGPGPRPGGPGGPRPDSKADLRSRAQTWAANGGPSEATVWGALGELSGNQQSHVAGAASSMSQGDFQDDMLSRATNPAHSPDVKDAYYTLGAAGREQVAAVVDFDQNGAISTPPSNGGSPPPSSPTPQPPTSDR